MSRATPPTRLATAAGAAAIAAIDDEGAAERIAAFETELRTAEEITTQRLDEGDRFPTVVAEHAGGVVAWARRALSSSPGLRRRRRALGGRGSSGAGQGIGGAGRDALCCATRTGTR